MLKIQKDISENDKPTAVVELAKVRSSRFKERDVGPCTIIFFVGRQLCWKDFCCHKSFQHSCGRFCSHAVCTHVHMHVCTHVWMYVNFSSTKKVNLRFPIRTQWLIFVNLRMKDYPRGLLSPNGISFTYLFWIWLVNNREGDKYSFFYSASENMWGVSSLLYKIKTKQNKTKKLIHGNPSVQGSEVFRPSCISLWKMLKIKNMNSFYIMAKMYYKEPKINHHSLWTGIAQHLRILQTLQNLYIDYVCYKNTPQGLKNDSGIHKCCSNPV